MKKKPFLLLEVVIAFTITTLFLVPLIREPLLRYKEELKALEASIANFVECCDNSCAGGPGPDCVILEDLTRSFSPNGRPTLKMVGSQKRAQ